MMPAKPFHFPIPPDALRMFRHIDRRHVFGTIARIGAETCVCDGYTALAVDRGHWLDSDFPEATEPFRERWAAIPWEPAPPPQGAHWALLDDARGALAAARHGNVRVGQSFIGTLTQIRQIARLPRCEVWVAGVIGEPLHFRFTGGRGVLACQPELYESITMAVALTILSPRRHTDGTLAGPAPVVTHRFGLTGWPPPEVVD